MIVFFNKIERKKLKAVVDFLYSQISESELEEQSLLNRTKFLTDELERIKKLEDRILKELLELASEKDILKEKDVQSE